MQSPTPRSDMPSDDTKDIAEDITQNSARNSAQDGAPDDSTLLPAGMPQTLRASAPDREARAFLRYFNALVRRPAADFPMETLRRRWQLMALALGRRILMDSVTTHHIKGPAGEIEMRIYRPMTLPRSGLVPAFVWCHGGAFLVGGIDTSDSICRNIARDSRAIVIALRYRLAPEHDLYAGREDVLAAVEWLAEHGATIGIDPERMAIGGDSAGGNIAAAVAQACVRRGGPKFLLQVLAYPATNIGKVYPSKNENASGYLLTAENMDWIHRVVAASVDFDDHWISPGRNPDLHGTPPALIITAGFDPIRDDGLEYTGRLRRAGVPVELLHYAGQFHGFLNFDSILVAARDALERIGVALRQAFDGTVVADETLEVRADVRTGKTPFGDMGAELFTATAVGWESMERWSETLLHVTSPRAATALIWATRPWLLPLRLTRSATSARINPLRVHQTYAAPQQPVA